MPSLKAFFTVKIRHIILISLVPIGGYSYYGEIKKYTREKTGCEKENGFNIQNTSLGQPSES